MGEICAILKIRCQDQDQAQKDPGRTLQEEINMHSEKTTIRLVAVDMDGTLLHDDKSISDYTLDVLRKIVKKRCDPGTCFRKTDRRNERSSIK